MSSFALPSTVCAASCMEARRDSPTFTPASASASMMRNRYAGPLPESPVTASSCVSSSTTVSPTESKIVFAVARSASVACSPSASAVAAAATVAGVFGIARTMRRVYRNPERLGGGRRPSHPRHGWRGGTRIVARQRTVDRQRSAANDQERDGDADGKQVILESFALLGPCPVHEEPDLPVHHQDRSDHQRADADRRQTGQETQDEQDGSSEFCGHYQHRHDGRKAHFGEALDRRRSAVAPEPTKDLLRAVRKEDDAEEKAHHQRAVIVASPNECVCHVPSRPIMHSEAAGFQRTSATR